ncbi:unnamed protein product [Allacma fusca]|uniref:Uncharacterized protein n=1 Tax=Allacma fusca TaxID=39272 RepID=A0A8J2PTC6_9HEXA|nr:unnamed protein product [Allacma fusca]
MEGKSEKSPGKDTAKSYQLIEIYIKIAVIINAVPFHYNRRTQQLSLDKHFLKYRIWIVLMFLGMILELSQVTREMIRAGLDDNTSRGEWALIFFIFLSWYLVTLLHYNALTNGNDMATYHNQVVSIRDQFGEKNLPPTSDHKMVRIHMITSMSQCFVQCLMVAAEGTRNQYIYSNVSPQYRSWLTAIIWAMYAYYRVSSNFLCGWFSVFAGIFHVQTCNQILQYRNNQNESSMAALKSYRLLQILCRQYNVAYATIFIPQITIFASLNIILGLFGTLRFYDKMVPSMYMNFPLMAVMILLLTFTFYPNNATVKEASEVEPRRLLIASTCLERGRREMVKNRWNTKAPKVDLSSEAGHATLGEENKISTTTDNFRENNTQGPKFIRCIARSCPFVATSKIFASLTGLPLPIRITVCGDEVAKSVSNNK